MDVYKKNKHCSCISANIFVVFAIFLIGYIKLKLEGQKIQLSPLLPPRSDGSGIKEEKNCTDKLSVKRTNNKSVLLML